MNETTGARDLRWTSADSDTNHAGVGNTGDVEGSAGPGGFIDDRRPDDAPAGDDSADEPGLRVAGLPDSAADGSAVLLGPRLDYTEFVRSRGAGLVRLARGLLRERHMAEDIVQDVLARALLQWPRVSAADDVDAYVRRMVVNACTSWFRRAVRREWATDSTLALDRPAADRTQQVADRDLLITLLQKLPAKQRAVLVLRHYEGLPDAEIAVLMNCTEVTVRSNAHRGLAKLRQLMPPT